MSFLVLRRVLGALRVGPEPEDNDVGIAVLGHQLVVVQRQVPRPRHTDTDRRLLSVVGQAPP